MDVNRVGSRRQCHTFLACVVPMKRFTVGSASDLSNNIHFSESHDLSAVMTTEEETQEVSLAAAEKISVEAAGLVAVLSKLKWHFHIKR